ncbi:MAG TPA: hypothetical protein VL049_30630 [Candidatus Dormibacteraeota bacterium]|nr:hypothetical protein [Candidatus Dormibacteraeota bacterium]
MALDLTVQMAPIFWGMIALLLVTAAAILAGVDPELAEIYLGDPRWWLASVAIAIVALVTIATTRPELTYGLRALLTN